MARHEIKPGANHAVEAIASAHEEITAALGKIPDTRLNIKVHTPSEGQWQVSGELVSTLGDGARLATINKPV